MRETILIVDDEKNIRRTLQMVLEGEGYETRGAESAEEALTILGTGDIDAVIMDVRLPRMSGIDALAEIRKQPGSKRLPVLMISGHASISEAVSAVQMGATDFFEKPLDRDRVLVTVRNALRTRSLEREVETFRAQNEKRYEMVAAAPVMQKLFADIERVAPLKARVLVTGESGTGKELIARAIHRLSPRVAGPFVKVNCAAIPAELIESELFGHEKGSFTGALNRKRGVFEVAHNGTLFLDEIGDMSLSAQAKVLRALQNEEIMRVGSEQTIRVDVRVVAATNKNLEAAVSTGAFREDLYFRLAVVLLRSPSLRERREDIALLADSFLTAFCEENGMRRKNFDPETITVLKERRWKGNVRELKNIVERMAILGEDPLYPEDVPPDTSVSPDEDDDNAADHDNRGSAPPRSQSPSAPAPPPDGSESLRDFRDRAERDFIVATLDKTDWNISRAASMLGVERTNLHKKIRALGIRRDAT